MTEVPVTSHGLDTFVDTRVGAAAGITLNIRSDLGHINLRGDPDDSAFLKAAESALGQALPLEPNTSCSGKYTIFWLGPDEWLVLAETGDVPGIVAALGGTSAAVNDLSGGQIALSLSDAKVRALLAKGCTIDLHPREFRGGTCAQSGLAKASVLIGMPGNDDEFLVIVRRSFSDYLLRWLSNAAAEYGIRIQAD